MYRSVMLHVTMLLLLLRFYFASESHEEKAHIRNGSVRMSSRMEDLFAFIKAAVVPLSA